MATDKNDANSSAWGDYDNDGDLDLLVTSAASSTDGWLSENAFYQNNGDGTFTRLTTGDPVYAGS